MEVLKSIYGEECVLYRDQHSCEIDVYPSDESRSAKLQLRLRVYFPESYPSSSEPVVEMAALWLPVEMIQKLNAEFRKLFLENVGNVVVFTWIEWLKEQDWVWEKAKHWMEEIGRSSNNSKPSTEDFKVDRLDQIESHKDGWGATSSELFIEDEKAKDSLLEDKSFEDLDKILGIFHGAPFTEKKSTFQAHLAGVSSVDQVQTVMDALLGNRKIAGATHNIMAYRISVPDKNTVLQDYDDDGETAAGGRLLHLLQIVDAIDVVVVVSRWFGGILLGPDRFKHINNVARSILSTCGYIKGSGESSSSNKKSQSRKGKR